ncbi:MAG: (2Fe-2S)-binding protein [Deltaproteobacteria bacterium]|nr:(2Fe-2S)-binding protein [Deltaproteobacteria bacterium]
MTAPPEELVCYCSRVTKGEILAAMRAGAGTLEEIKKVTGACTVSRCKELSPRGR